MQTKDAWRTDMATFVLVAGAWSGGYRWRAVAQQLRAAGHDVYTPTLTGLGERVHLVSRAVDLDTHILDVVNVLVYEDLIDVVLVGHSYAGMVITGVADRVPERVGHLVYIEAPVPHAGESQADNADQTAQPGLEDLVRREGDGWLVPVPRFPDGSPMSSRLTPHPFATVTQKLHLTNEHATAALPKTYILCTETPQVQWRRSYLESRIHGPEWRLVELPTTHAPMTTMPERLVAALLETAKSRSSAGL
jgi:pimeloyl-ACP methyl ester carboxylesterase